MLRVFLCFVAVALGLLSGEDARAAREIRLALVITNNAYDNTTPLTAAHADGANIKRALEQVGFSTVEVVQDATQEAMRQAILRFVELLKRTNDTRDDEDKVVSFFYFAGHGGADARFPRNYIFPRDVRAVRSEDLDRTAIEVEDVIRWIAEGEPAASFLVFDACRNVTADNDAEGLQTRYVEARDVPGRPLASRQRTLIGYATEFGHTTNDTNYLSQELSARIVESASEASLAFQEARRAVVERTRAMPRPQTPVVQDNLESALFFRAGAANAAKDPGSSPPPRPAPVAGLPPPTSDPIVPPSQITVRPSITPAVAPQPDSPRDARPSKSPAAQPSMIGLVPGSAFVTGFSGTAISADGRRSIDVAGQVARVIDLAGGPATRSAAVPVPLTAGQIGQVFGIAIDPGGAPSPRGPTGATVYLAATSTFGLPIVARDATGVERPLERGGPGATWAEGLFGARRNGGPGSVWKVDAASGRVTLFADVHLNGVPNGGPSLGQLAYDPRTRQLFLSDLATGMIHRLNTAGDDLGQFDHGGQGRPKQGLPPILLNRSAPVAITSPAFDPSQPSTWGYVAAGRRIWGLAARYGRLFYAVSEGPQIWSVGIRGDGTFADDARLEVDIKGLAVGSEIPRIDFDAAGYLYTAVLPDMTIQIKHDAAGKPDPAAILRFKPVAAPPGALVRWSPDPEAIYNDSPSDPGSLGGGFGFGYGFDSSGRVDDAQCRGSLWATAWRERSSDRAQQGEPRMLLHWAMGAGGAQLETPDRAISVEQVQARGGRAVAPLGSIATFAPCAMEPDVASPPPPLATSQLSPPGRIEATATPGPGMAQPLPPSPADRPPSAVGPRPPSPPAPASSAPRPGPGVGGPPGAATSAVSPCLTVKAAGFQCVGQAWEADLFIEESSGRFLDSLRTSSLAIDGRVGPGRQKRMSPAAPFRIRFDQARAGSTVPIDVCLFDDAASRDNMPYRCCRARIDVELPRQACAQPTSR